MQTDITGTIEKPTPPEYKGNKLYTRDELVDLIRADWGPNMNRQDVDLFIRNARLKPVNERPFPPMGELPENDRKRKEALIKYEDARSNTRREREQFCLNGIPKFVPSSGWPSPNDPEEVRAAKYRRIENL